MTDYRQAVRLYADKITELRKAFHRRPELGNEEYETADRIESFLRDCGIETRRVLGTGIVGVLHGGRPGRTVALRSDIDALPVQEATGCPFASEIDGKMHACGHDVHMAAALGAARMLAAEREFLPGRIVFLFQPDEEMNGGAERMIREGCLEGVEAVFGAHVSPDLPEGCAGFRSGKFYAASDMFVITVTGKSSHGAEREKGIDALAAAAKMTTALLALPPEITRDRAVLTVGKMHAGTARNIVPDTAVLEGILRSLGPETRKALKDGLRETAERIARETGTKADVRIIESYPGVVNDGAMTEFAASAAAKLLGPDHVIRIPEPTMVTEDFGYFLEEVPGSFYHIGAGSPYPLHNPQFLPTDEAVLTGAALHAAVLTAFLNTGTETE
ncbi:MAG: amidohydrolase [Mogibacterium sp.]|nr:amidohydrolase [Mogibacterium sp.]